MVATVLPSPRQLSYLEAPSVSRFDVVRLSWWIHRLCYTDALISGMFRLERNCYQQIASMEADNAVDGALVTGSYAEYTLFIAGRLVAVVETRSENGARVVDIHERLAVYLLAAGWQITTTRLVEGGAMASPSMCLDRVKRLLKGE